MKLFKFCVGKKYEWKFYDKFFKTQNTVVKCILGRSPLNGEV